MKAIVLCFGAIGFLVVLRVNEITTDILPLDNAVIAFMNTLGIA